MKKFLCGLLVGILLMVSVPAFGAVGQQVTLVINPIKAIVNGQEMTADRFIYKGRTYVQLKELTDMLGGELLWDKENNAAIATFNLNKPTEEVDPLPLKDIEESKPATEPQAEPQNEPTTRETPSTQNQEPQQDSGGGEQPEEPDEPEPPEEPEPPKTRTTTLVYDGAKCSCGTTGFLLNRRTIYQGGQEYDVCDARCHNPRCRFFNQVIGEVRWLVEYK